LAVVVGADQQQQTHLGLIVGADGCQVIGMRLRQLLDAHQSGVVGVVAAIRLRTFLLQAYVRQAVGFGSVLDSGGCPRDLIAATEDSRYRFLDASPQLAVYIDQGEMGLLQLAMGYLQTAAYQRCPRPVTDVLGALGI